MTCAIALDFDGGLAGLLIFALTLFGADAENRPDPSSDIVDKLPTVTSVVSEAAAAFIAGEGFAVGRESAEFRRGVARF